MIHTPKSDRTILSRSAVRVAAVAAIAFYVTSANLTRGHEADFGKQWLAARLVASGHGASLFNLEVQRSELDRHYSQEVIERGIWREGIGGPTYPPTFAVLFAPLGWLSPAAAQWVVVELSVLLVVVAAQLISRMSAGRVSTETAVLAMLCLPSFFLAIGVGQNSAISLAILVGGFALLAGRRDFLAGLVWGLFAIKPTWGVAIVWIPAVLVRPRAYLGMAVTGAALVGATLPICGVQSWFDWFRLAQQVEHYYQVLPRWTALSRDLPGLLRRVGDGRAVKVAGWVCVCGVVAVTAKVWWLGRGSRDERIDTAGPRAVALFAAIVLSCPRFMFYDMTLAVVPFLVAFAGWREMRVGARYVLASLTALLWLGTAFNFAASTMLGVPLDTLSLVFLWLWSVAEVHAWAAGRGRARPIAAAATPSTEWLTRPA